MSSPATTDKVCGFRVDPSSHSLPRSQIDPLAVCSPWLRPTLCGSSWWESFWAQRNGSNMIQQKKFSEYRYFWWYMLSAVWNIRRRTYKNTYKLYSYTLYTLYTLHTMARQIYIIFSQGTLGIAPPKSQIDQWPGLVAMYGGIVFGTSTRGIFSWPEILRTNFTWLY